MTRPEQPSNTNPTVGMISVRDESGNNGGIPGTFGDVPLLSTDRDDRISLAPLAPEDALRALLQTGRPD